MQTEVIQTNFTKGINRDVPFRFQPEGTYRHALNKRRSTESFYSAGLTNELQNKHAADIPGKVIGYHRLEERNSTLFFHVDSGSCISIFNHDNNSVKLIVRDTDFGCDWGFKECKWIGYGHSDSKSIAPCNDIIIYWASGNTYYKANIDELQDENRRNSIKKQENVCDYFKLFKEIATARVKMRTNRGGGRDLPPGQYYSVVQALDESGNESNWGTIEGPVFIGSKYNKFTDFSNQSIQIQAKFLSKEYSRIRIAVIPPVGSVAQDIAYVIYDGSYNTNGVTAEYYSPSQHKEEIPLSEILTKDIKFLRGSNLIADDGKLHLYKTIQEFNPKVQEWAEKAKVYAVAFAVPLSQAHKFRSFRPDEVYPFGVEWMYTDQTVTAVGHIPGNIGTANDLQCGQCDLPLGHTTNDAALVETYNTIPTDGQESICGSGGQQLTVKEQNDGSKPTQIVDCPSEDVIEPRDDGSVPCVDHTADKEAVEQKIESYQNTSEGLKICDGCDCVDCVDEKTKNDLDQTEGILINSEEQMTDLLRTDKEVAEDCTTGDHDTLPAAGKTLYEEGVEKAEDDEEFTLRTVITKSGGTNATPQKGTHTFILQTTKGEDCITEDVEPILLGKYTMAGWNSALKYPETLDCDGKPLYGRHGEPINHHKFPDTSLVPLFYSTQRGVESRFDPANTPGKDTYVVMWGIQVENVYTPSYEAGEIPKPLDKNTPWRIVMGKRERHNQTVIYSGYVTNTFKGFIGGKEYAVPRHAANAYPAVDRTILTSTGSHLGEDWAEPIYNFHSPDMGTATDFINGDYIKVTGRLTGDGNMYGLYDEGKSVKDEEHRLDRRGARSAMNFTQWESLLFQTCLSGIDFAEFNTNLQNPTGVDYPLINKFRESSIYLQTAEALPNVGTNGKDKSFNTGGLDHEYPTKGQVLFATIKRFNSQQYGSIESLQYVDIGMIGRPGQETIRMLTGDAFVQKWSHKRTSYISDKVGNKLNVDFPITAADEFLGPAGAGGRDRGVCDPPNRRGYRMKEFLGFWNALELPMNGDKKDPKNMANGHPTKSAFQIWGSLDVPGTDVTTETDIFYARTFVGLNHFPAVDTDTNLYYRTTSVPEIRELFYEELQGIDVDSSINNVDPNDAWLNDWHNEHKQPTKKQLEKKAKLRFLLVVTGPALLAALMARINTSLQGNTTSTVSPYFGSMWLTMVYNLLSGKKLDKFLGFPPCKEDDEGAQGEDNTKGLRDNWTAYNYGFSDVNSQNLFIGMPAIYNTCKCDDPYTNIIYTSNRQIDTSPYDAWANFQALSYTGIAGDSGQLERMFVWGNGIYAQTTDGLYQLQHKNAAIQTTGGELLLGSGGFVDNPAKVMEGTFEGFGGTSDPNCGAGFRGGYISMDYEAKDITIFNGQFQSIVGRNCGMHRDWKKYFTFCGTGDRDQMCSTGIHYAFGYDPEYEVLMVTKHDGAHSKTWSFDLADQRYVSEHSYVPDFYFWDRNKLFMVKDSAIYRANMPGAYTTYFGSKYPSSVDVVARSKNSETFTYGHSVLDTEVSQLVDGVPAIHDRDETYDHLTAWNDFQQTGRLPIYNEDQTNAHDSTKDKSEIKISRRELGKWKLNNYLSNELNRDIPVVTKTGCWGIEQPNAKNIDPNPPDQKAKTIKGKYLVQRFEFVKNDRQIVFYGMNTHTNTPEEK